MSFGVVQKQPYEVAVALRTRARMGRRSWERCRFGKAEGKLVPDLCWQAPEGHSTRKSEATRYYAERCLVIILLSRRTNSPAMEVR